jgi:hypothetical protein
MAIFMRLAGYFYQDRRGLDLVFCSELFDTDTRVKKGDDEVGYGVFSLQLRWSLSSM